MRALALLVPIFVIGCTDDPGSTTKDRTVINDKDGDGFTSADGDCDDNDDTVYPMAPDVVGDSKDQNCDGVDGVDDDSDGEASEASGGPDCNDDDAEIFSGADEIGWDGIDQNCDGEDQYDFQNICAGKYHTCALDTTGTVHCWGRDEHGQISQQPSGDAWTDIDCGYEYTCVVNDKTGELFCWGRDEPGRNQVSFAPTKAKNHWVSIHTGWYHGCVIDVDGTYECWGDDVFQQVSDAPLLVPMLDMGLGESHTCGITRNLKFIECWGDDSSDQLTRAPDPGYFDNFVQITSGALHSCAVRDDLGLMCWGGDNSIGQAESPNDAGPYSYIDAFGDFTCGVLESENLLCWGIDTSYQVSLAPDDESIFLTGTGVDHACAIRNSNGSIFCWGRNDWGQTDVPDWP